ncbi:hypothetical protein [Pedobacter zeae]|uniref:Uncharacterized protein n=1 Tax=Pedobacter zeae TaxID=1737356 RepID=A0A7W6P6A7_9SPHI|nr:hypothetical protein [Pedobacter zeae]MBB4107739.1 hypothetical protein [Pedobacter zeae]GGG97379.1 hypothetical protein GCM10007422_09150 [Pedobacter zeae]
MNLQEIQAEMATNTALKTELLGALESDLITHAKAKGIIVRTADEEAAHLKNYEKEKLDPRISEIYTGIDKDVLEASGIERQPQEKTYAYVKRVAASLLGEKKDLEKKLSDAMAGKGDELTKAELNTLKTSLAEKEQALKDLQENSKKETFTLKVGFGIDRFLAGQKIYVPAHVPEDKKKAYIEARINAIKTDFLNTFKPEETDKGIVFKDASGTIQMNAAKAAPKTEAELIAERYEFDFEQEGGSGGGAGSGGKGGKVDDAVLLAEVKDKQSLYEYLAKKGLITGSEAWKKEYEEVSKKLNIQ